ncbi:MAG: aldo/keto reductase [Lachnospiraceae bacterium]|nr:aldo/keto reductase [Lachnospiraceae bacterium]
MNYRNLNNPDKLSTLGFGCMRFPKKGNGFDHDEIEREIRFAIEGGVNYFDTAYLYPGNEEAFGKALEKIGARDKIHIATKMPHYFMKSVEEAEKRFNEQLARLRTDYVDYYLMHMLPDVRSWQALCDRGIDKWLEDKKKEGRIKRVGFSFHGSSELFIKILHSYKWEFAQIQYNYIDENTQAGARGLKEAAAMGIPVIIMEPLRGGRLVNAIPEKAKEMIKTLTPGWSPAEFGLRWLWNQPEVTTVLSGMNSMDMVTENIRIASETEENALTEDDMRTYEKVIAEIERKTKVKCTGCGYCMPCPAGVDIPGCFKTYNTSYIESYIDGVREYFMCTAMKNEKAMASQCMKCGKCETHCPQGIHIRDELVRVKRRFENPIFKIAMVAAPGRLKK